MKKYRILLTLEFKDWMLFRIKKERLQIQERLDLIAMEGHFGDHKGLEKNNSNDSAGCDQLVC
jgi:hypothetical protein